VKTSRSFSGDIFEPSDDRWANPARKIAQRVNQSDSARSRGAGQEHWWNLPERAVVAEGAGYRDDNSGEGQYVVTGEHTNPNETGGTKQTRKRSVVAAFECPVRVAADQHHPNQSSDERHRGEQPDRDSALHVEFLDDGGNPESYG